MLYLYIMEILDGVSALSWVLYILYLQWTENGVFGGRGPRVPTPVGRATGSGVGCAAPPDTGAGIVTGTRSRGMCVVWRPAQVRFRKWKNHKTCLTHRGKLIAVVENFAMFAFQASVNFRNREYSLVIGRSWVRVPIAPAALNLRR
jgi:hypothetical protein